VNRGDGGGAAVGDSVAIVGLGGVGTSAVLGAALAGAGSIIAVDRDERRLEQAARLGAVQTIADTDGTAAQRILELSGGGVDLAFETAGTLGAFETAYGAVRRGGTVVSVGLVDPKTPFALDIAGLVTGARTVKGSYMGSCNPALDIPKYVELYTGGHFPVEKLISHHLPLDDVNSALDRMAENEALRQIIEP
jgi:alcohol dehydrogenase